MQLAFAETFEALLSGLQGALWAREGVPQRVRLDNLSTATHELALTGGRKRPDHVAIDRADLGAHPRALRD